jgi:hypothetical protein
MQGVGVVGGSPRSSYLSWYNRQSGNWATWEPGALVEPGDVGRFERDGCFKPSGTLADYKIRIETGRRERFGAVLLSSDEDVKVEGKTSATLSAAFAFLGKGEAGMKFTANRQYACVLHMRGISESWILDPDPALEAIRQALLNEEWPLDRVIVVRRLKVERGFAAIFQKAGQSFEVKAAAGLNVMDLADLEGIEFDLAAKHQRGGVQFYDFAPDATPAFSSAIRVQRDLWDKLLRWRRGRGVLIGPDGSRYTGPPADLSKYLPKDLLYDPGSSPMPPGELAAIPLEDLFEEVHTLPPEIDPNLEQATQPSARVLSFPHAVTGRAGELFPLPARRQVLAGSDAGTGSRHPCDRLGQLRNVRRGPAGTAGPARG